MPKNAIRAAHTRGARFGALRLEAVIPRRFRSCSLSLQIVSSASVTGEEITYPPLAHFPRSMVRHRVAAERELRHRCLLPAFLQIGQRSLMVRFRGISVHFGRVEGGRLVRDAANLRRN